MIQILLSCYSLFLLLLGFAIIVIDQLTKYFVFSHKVHNYVVTSLLSLHYTQNRGISWGMLHSSQNFIFYTITMFIGAFLLCFCWYTIDRYRQGYSIIAEMLVLCGGISNFIDRIWYEGVIDFICLSYHQWTFPLFNLADCSIVLGVVYILCKALLLDKKII